MSDKVYNVLFVCTHNSARSIMAEGILNSLGRGQFKAFSAGSHPGTSVNPFALKTLSALRIPSDGYRSKDWDEFARPGAPAARLRLHGLRQGGRRAVPGLARTADDGPLGRGGSGRLRGHGRAEGEGVLGHGGRPQAPHRTDAGPASGVAGQGWRSSARSATSAAAKAMSTTTLPSPAATPAPMSVFERYLSVWVFLCIVVGIALGQWLPGPVQAIGRMEVAQVNLPVGAADLGDDHPDAAEGRLRRIAAR